VEVKMLFEASSPLNETHTCVIVRAPQRPKLSFSFFLIPCSCLPQAERRESIISIGVVYMNLWQNRERIAGCCITVRSKKYIYRIVFDEKQLCVSLGFPSVK